MFEKTDGLVNFLKEWNFRREILHLKIRIKRLLSPIREWDELHVEINREKFQRARAINFIGRKVSDLIQEREDVRKISKLLEEVQSHQVSIKGWIEFLQSFRKRLEAVEKTVQRRKKKQ